MDHNDKVINNDKDTNVYNYDKGCYWVSNGAGSEKKILVWSSPAHAMFYGWKHVGVCHTSYASLMSN